MSLFTNTEAKACKMSRCDFIEDTWVIGVIDDNNLYYEVSLENLDSNASKADIQNATITALCERTKLKKRTIISKQDSDDIGIGSSLG